MRNLLARRLLRSAFDSSRSIAAVSAAANPSRPFSVPSRQYAVSASFAEEEAETVTFPREVTGVSYGLNWALAGKGVIVNDKAFHNLKPSELKQNGATTVEHLSGLPIHVRGSAVGGASEISKAQFSKLLKQVTSHISSIPTVFVQDGAVGSFSKCDAKVRVISDSASAVSSFSEVLWKTPSRAISHDTCPLTVYVASSISPSVGGIIDLKSQANTGFIAADIECSSLILCGKAFADINGIKDALAALAAPIISARKGVPLHSRILLSGDSVVLLFAPDEFIQSCPNLQEVLVSKDAGVVLSSHGVTPFFQTRGSPALNLLKRPASVVLISADSTGVLPPISKLSPGQAVYHFLAGYQDGKFLPTYGSGPSPIPQLELAKALLSHLECEISSFLVNVSNGGKRLEGKELIKLVESTLSKSIPESSLGSSSDPKVGDLKGKFKSFLSAKFQELPEEFSF